VLKQGAGMDDKPVKINVRPGGPLTEGTINQKRCTFIVYHDNKSYMAEGTSEPMQGRTVHKIIGRILPTSRSKASKRDEHQFFFRRESGDLYLLERIDAAEAERIKNAAV